MRTPGSFSPDDVVVGHSARMRAIFDFAKVVSRSDSSVIITGESGTGKEVIANLLHHSSSRRHQPFVAVSCALFSENLIETELFGHERGAFTGAIKDKPGRFEMAQGGTLFLDDIDDVPLSMQVKLLRAIQNRTVERVGGTRSITVNVRVITGSKRDLTKMVAEGNFREDLFYRLNVLPIVLPPLRERREDIGVLTDFFFKKFSRARGIEVPSVSPTVRYAFSRYRWPGNVRELENACERIVQTCTCGTVRIGCVAAGVLFGSTDPSPVPMVSEIGVPEAPAISLDDRLREVESNLIVWALKASDGNKSKAAELLSIKRSTLGDRIARCGLGDPAARADAPMANEAPMAASA
jgi:sigma-54 dependent transcriptional regulator, flagellar regulatory protein